MQPEGQVGCRPPAVDPGGCSGAEAGERLPRVRGGEAAPGFPPWSVGSPGPVTAEAPEGSPAP